MRNILVEINCKHCFYHTNIKSHTQVLASLEGNLKAKIMEHTMFTYQCPRCGQIIEFRHDFLYCDPQRHFLVYMSQNKDNVEELQQQFPQDILCYVDHPNDLAETIRILEDGLNVPCITMIKHKLKHREHQDVDIRYNDVDKETIWFLYQYKTRNEMKGVCYSDYQNMLTKGEFHE